MMSKAHKVLTDTRLEACLVTSLHFINCARSRVIDPERGPEAQRLLADAVDAIERGLLESARRRGSAAVLMQRQRESTGREIHVLKTNCGQLEKRLKEAREEVAEMEAKLLEEKAKAERVRDALDAINVGIEQRGDHDIVLYQYEFKAILDFLSRPDSEAKEVQAAEPDIELEQSEQAQEVDCDLEGQPLIHPEQLCDVVGAATAVPITTNQ